MATELETTNISIQAKNNGPLLVKGLNKIKLADGEEKQTGSTFSLCRCGQSANKPFCDGTHSKVGFSGERIIAKPLDKERAYAGQKITIHDNRTICSHAAFCGNRLSSVFDSNKRPWIDPDGADVDEIIEVVKQCPSGALSYSVEGVPHRDVEREPGIEVEKGGPYYVSGNIELNHELQPPSKGRYALCRCGKSKNKPFCDGTHYEVSFD